MGDPRSSRAWRKLRDQVVAEEPLCRLRIQPVCTGRSQTADHIIPVVAAPRLALARHNLQGACHACNQRRNAKPLADIRTPKPEALQWFD